MSYRNITLQISEELRASMQKYPEVNWSEVVRSSIRDYILARELKE